jgi:hypothetical protein
LLTLKQEDQAILPNPKASFMVKSSRNNGGSGPNAHLYARDGREEKGEDGASFFVLLIYDCRFLAQTNSDSPKSLSVLGYIQLIAGASHEPAVMWTFTTGFGPPSIIF